MELFFLCMKIFIARIMDVSIGTLRIIYLGKGKSKTAFICGFCEVFIWFLVAKDALNSDSNSWWIVISYSLGYAVGTYIGSYLSEVFVKGNFGVQVITSRQNHRMIDTLRKAGYAVTVMEVQGKEEKHGKYLLLIEINKHSFEQLSRLIKSMDEKAFIIVNETKYIQNGYIK